ncbi:MAG: LuxR C-terminal-related transcriptional regulator [bacterium]
MAAPLRIAVLEDEPLYRELLVTGLITRLDGVEVAGSFSTGETLLAEVDPASVDVLLADVDLGPGMDGPQAAVALRRLNPEMGVVLLSNFAMPGLLAALPDDVRGGWSYLLKTSVSDLDQLTLAIRGAASGGVVVDEALTRNLVPQRTGPLQQLTPRQIDVLSRMANGWSNKRIAEDLFLSVRTVESIISDIIAQLAVPKDTDGYNARVACVLIYLRHSVSRSRRTPAR